MEFHVFKKPKKLKSGKTVYRWYYYYLDENKKQVQKACKGCKTRKEAEDYIRSLSCADDSSPAVRVRDIAQNMFLPNSDHMDRRRQLGKPLDFGTMRQARHFAEAIIETWGDISIAQVDPAEITKFLFSVDRSGSWKNRYTSIFREIYAEAKWYGCKIQPPHFDWFRQESKKADIFTTGELKRLFVPENFPSRTLYLFFLLCLSGGLRLGETRAVRPKQILFERNALIVDGFCKEDGSRTTYNKTGSPDNPRFRIVLLPGFTTTQLAEYILENGISLEDFCFSIDGKPVKRAYAQYTFRLAMEKAGTIRSSVEYRKSDEHKPGGNVLTSSLMPDGRRLCVHSLRYTYVTRMRRELPAELVMKMVGHTKVDMTDYYTKKALEESLAGIMDAVGAVDNLF
ncbi:MAG: site-specific integrase, partial [Spirochaetaceae bacterium]|nr:site-specific integrase [Spirochaetaceae bacterium]